MVQPIAEEERDYWRLRPNAPMPGTVLGPASEVPDGGAKEYRFGGRRSAFAMFVIRQGEAFRGYLNLCPHYSLPLNHAPDQFIDHAGFVQCVQHYARFRAEDGLCIDGACVDRYLSPVPVEVDGAGMLRIRIG